MNSTEPKHEACAAREASDNVVGHSERDIRIIRFGPHRQQLLGILVGFLEPLQGLDMLLLENHVGIRFHSGRQGESEESFRVACVYLQALAGEFPGVLDSLLKTLHARRIGLAFNAVEEFFFVQEEIARERALAIELLEEVTGRNRNFAKRLAGILRFPAGKFFARFGNVLEIKGVKSGGELRHAAERGTSGVSLRASAAEGPGE